MSKFIIKVTCGLLLSISCYSSPFDPAKAEQLGFSPERLSRVTDHIDQRVNEDLEAGLQLLIVRKGEVVVRHNAGLLHGEKIISDDSIFFVHSMMKPVTSLAALQLFEEGRILLADPIAKYLPEYKNMNIYVSGSGDEMVTKPAENSITILHLLTHTAGYTYDYGFIHPEVAEWYKTIDYSGDLASVVTQMSKTPLTHEPGTAWEYSSGTTILARLVEVVSGEKFSDYIQRRIFDPLQMVDSGFKVEESQLSRLASRYYRNDEGKLKESDWDRTRNTVMPKYTAGDSGLYTTSNDYLRFCLMIMNRGELDGVRVAAPRTIDIMTTDFVPPSVPKPILPPGRGFTPGFSIYADHAQTQSMVSEGSVYWGAASGSIFWIDFNEELIVIMMTQSYPPNAPRSQIRLESLVYQSLIH